MVDTVKFQFDTPFDLSRKAAERPRTYSEDEVAQLRQVAFGEGAEAGAAAARQEAEHLTAEALATLAGGIEALGRAQAAANEKLRREAAVLAFRIASRLAPALMQRHPLAEVEALLAGCLAELHEEPRVVVRASEPLVAGLKPRIEELAAGKGYPGTVVLLPDDSLQGSDCRVEWADGGIERDTAAVAARIEEALGRFLKSQDL